MIGLPLRVSRKLCLRRSLVSFVVAVRKLKKGKCSSRAHVCSFWVSQSALAGSILLLKNVSILCALLYHYGQTLMRLLSSNFAQAHRVARQDNEKSSRWPNMGKLRGPRGDQQNHPKAVRLFYGQCTWITSSCVAIVAWRSTTHFTVCATLSWTLWFLIAHIPIRSPPSRFCQGGRLVPYSSFSPQNWAQEARCEQLLQAPEPEHPAAGFFSSSFCAIGDCFPFPVPMKAQSETDTACTYFVLSSVAERRLNEFVEFTLNLLNSCWIYWISFFIFFIHFQCFHRFHCFRGASRTLSMFQ